MKIQIINHTDFETSHIRALIRETVKRFLPDRRKAWGMKVSITYRRSNSFLLGQGSINGNWIRLNLRRPIDLSKSLGKPIDIIPNDTRQICETIWHEIQHNLGYRHRDIGHPDMNLFNYALDMPLALHVATSKPNTQEIMRMKLKRSQNKVKQATTRAKRAESILKKWQRKVKYYKRKRANETKV